MFFGGDVLLLVGDFFLALPLGFKVGVQDMLCRIAFAREFQIVKSQ
jgi:hypothetical protein